MPLKADKGLEHSAGAIDEGEPLPPEDRIVDRVCDDVADGRSEWLERLYRNHRDKLMRFAVRHTRPDRAPDIVQQLFLRLATRRGGELHVETSGAYLRQAAVNLIRNEARYANRRAAQLHISSEDIQLSGGDPVAAYEARDMLARLEAVVAELEPRTREIFLAHRIDGFSYGEIALRTGLSVKTVEKHMSRAIRHVTQRLEP